MGSYSCNGTQTKGKQRAETRECSLSRAALARPTFFDLFSPESNQVTSSMSCFSDVADAGRLRKRSVNSHQPLADSSGTAAFSAGRRNTATDNLKSSRSVSPEQILATRGREKATASVARSEEEGGGVVLLTSLEVADDSQREARGVERQKQKPRRHI